MSFRITLRYEIPGYVFLALAVVLVWEPLVENILAIDISRSVFSAFIAFISGPPIGFVITQFWYAIFDNFFRWSRKIDEEPMKTFVSYGVKENAVAASIAFNYIYNKHVTSSYRTVLQNRLNLYHSICSTITALVLGIVTGILLRLYFETSYLLDWVHLLIGGTCLIIVLLILYFRQKSVHSEINEMRLFIIRTLKKTIVELPDEYKKVDQKSK